MRRLLPTLLSIAGFLAAFLAAHDGAREEIPGGAPGARSGAMESLEFWSAARSYPGGNIPPDNYYRAFEWARRAEMKKRPLPFGSSGWKSIGPSNLSGRMLAVALNPQNPNTIYAGSASGGLWRSHTGGLAGDWERVTTGFPVLGVAAIAIDPADSNVIYIGTGEVYRYAGTAGGLVVRTTRGSYGMGILKTTDGGSTWTKSLDWSYHQERGVQAVRLNPLNPSTVWAATSEGIFRSTDAGATWTNNLAILMGQEVLIHPADTLRMLASTGNLGLNNFVLRTTDGGSNWELASPADFSGKALLAMYPANPDIVYASIADSTTGVGSLWRTTDFGSGWTERSNSTTHPIFQVQGWYSHFVAVHALDSSIVVHAGVPSGRSTDGGVTFAASGGTYSDHHAWAADPSDPDILYVANDDGIFRSVNFGQTFTKVSQNLGTGQFYNGFSSSATDSLIALGQVQDHIPGYLYSGSPVWASSAADEVGWTGIDQANDFIMYAGTRGGGSIRKSTNRGASFGAAGGGFSGLACWNAPFVVSPSQPNVLYFGRSRIFKSTNGAVSWTATNGGTELDGNPPLSMAVSATNPDVVYAGTAPVVTRTHVFRTTNGGTSWTDVTGPLPDRYPLDIAVDPGDPSVAYVAYGGALTGHVFKTTDAGAGWTDITGDLPDIPATALLVDPGNSQVVYLGTDIGVYISTNAGAAWEPFNDGLPEAVLVADLSLTPSNRTLRVATHGNSVWERKLPETFPAISGVEPSGGEDLEVGTSHPVSWTQTLVASVDIDYSTDDGTSWLPVASSVPAYPDTFAWTVPATVTAAGRVRVRSSSDTLLAAQSAGAFAITFDGVILGVSAGWNLLSVPMIVADPARTAIFPASEGPAYVYDGGYAAAESLGVGPGYWLRFPSGELIPVAGDSVAADTVALSAGWNLIGSVTAPVPAGSLATLPPGMLVTPFHGYDGSYSTSDTLLPGRGYWVKSAGAGSLVLESPPPSATPGNAFARSPIPPPTPGRDGTLLIADALGRTAKLTIAQDEPGAARMESADLPPVPPAGGFDVRFANGSGRCSAGDRVHPILTQGVRLPAAISWDLPPGVAYILTAGAGREIAMRGSGMSEITSVSGLGLRIGPGGAGPLPRALVLDQNFPNPFNPSTRISFGVPPPEGAMEETVPVSLKIYDVSGRLAATVVEANLLPGTRTVEWDAASRPGGVYFGVLRAGTGTRTIKMLLLK